MNILLWALIVCSPLNGICQQIATTGINQCNHLAQQYVSNGSSAYCVPMHGHQ